VCQLLGEWSGDVDREIDEAPDPRRHRRTLASDDDDRARLDGVDEFVHADVRIVTVRVSMALSNPRSRSYALAS